MWKKEITDTLRQTGIVVSFLLIMPFVFIVNQATSGDSQLLFSWYIDWGMGILLPILILYLSYMMFSYESSDDATEYLKSLPLNKWKLLAIKIIPRFVIITAIAFIYHSIFSSDFLHIGRFSWFFLEQRPLSMMHTMIVITLPLIFGFMFGISSRNNILLAFAFLLPITYFITSQVYFISRLSHQIYRLWWSAFPNTDIHYFFELDSFLRVFLPTLLSILVLIPVFRSWDCSSGKIRSQKIIKRMSIPLIFIIALFTIDHLKLLF